MVTLASVKESNALISKLPPGLVGVFTGATAGIGEAALKQFVHDAVKPRCYFVGRSEEAAQRIIEECKGLNPDAAVVFIRADLSLMKEVDRVAEKIKSQEKAINVMFLSSGAALFDRNKTSEGLHALLALSIYGRARLTQQLLPLLQNAQHLSRVICIGAGTHEGKVYPEDWQAFSLPLVTMRGHLVTSTTLLNLRLAQEAPSVSFIHNHPGFVWTNLMGPFPGLFGVFVRTLGWIASWFLAVPIEESGQWSTWLATSARFPAKKKEGKDGVELVEGVDVAKGIDGVVGSGVYTVDQRGNVQGEAVEKLLDGYRKDGTMEKLWQYVQGEFKRIEEMK